jgi:hypothetical protein
MKCTAVHNIEQVEPCEIKKNTYQNSASMIISLQRASMAEACNSGNYVKKKKNKKEKEIRC